MQSYHSTAVVHEILEKGNFHVIKKKRQEFFCEKFGKIRCFQMKKEKNCKFSSNKMGRGKIKLEVKHAIVKPKISRY